VPRRACEYKCCGKTSSGSRHDRCLPALDVMANAHSKMTYNYHFRDRHFDGHGFFHFKDKQWIFNSPNSSGGW
jgi:hypothetical protein